MREAGKGTILLTTGGAAINPRPARAGAGISFAAEVAYTRMLQRDGSRSFNRLCRAISGAAISVPTLGLPADPERLIDAVSAYLDDPSPLRDPDRERRALEARLAPGD